MKGSTKIKHFGNKYFYGLVYLAFCSCSPFGVKYIDKVETDGKYSTIIFDKTRKETVVFIDSLMLKEETGDYNVEEVLSYPSLTPIQSEETRIYADSLFRRVMEKSKMDSLRKRFK